jgi:S1-C subfamily serine protease
MGVKPSAEGARRLIVTDRLAIAQRRPDIEEPYTASIAHQPTPRAFILLSLDTMADSTTGWAFPDAYQPQPAELAFDIQHVLSSVVRLRAEVPGDAYTAPTLGTERAGNGVVIGNNGLVLTIGYLITEAQSIWLTTLTGTVVPGFPLLYAYASGLGLVQAAGPLGVSALPRAMKFSWSVSAAAPMR